MPSLKDHITDEQQSTAKPSSVNEPPVEPFADGAVVDEQPATSTVDMTTGTSATHVEVDKIGVQSTPCVMVNAHDAKTNVKLLPNENIMPSKSTTMYSSTMTR